jgi:uncharacterized membrane protein
MSGKLAENIGAIERLERLNAERRSRFARIGDWVTRLAGTTWAVVVHLIWFAVWILWNTGSIALAPFDPYPFNLLTMIVSLEVIFFTLFVIANQNQLRRDADHRAHVNLQVNMLAEQEMTAVLRMLRDLCGHFGIETLSLHEIKDLAEDTDIGEVAQRVEDQVTEVKTGSRSPRATA